MPDQPKKWVNLAQAAVAQTKKVLAVEGQTDVSVYLEWIKKQLGPNWANQVHLEDAKDRSTLLAGLRWLNDTNDPAKDGVFGLADRDEWEPNDVAQLVAEMPTLLVNEARHSLESYFCDPDEIAAILAAWDAASGTNTFRPRMPDLQQQIQDARQDYIPNWALGHIIQRANERIREDAQYPKFFRDTCPLPPDAEIQTKLQEWAAILAPDDLFGAFDALRSASLARPLSEQYQSCIEPKLFFGKIVVDGPNGLNSFQQNKSKDWLVLLARWSPSMPADLQTTLAPVLT